VLNYLNGKSQWHTLLAHKSVIGNPHTTGLTRGQPSKGMSQRMGASEVRVPTRQARSAEQARALRLVSALRFRRCSRCLRYEHSYSDPHDAVCKELEHPRRPRRKQFRDFGIDIVLALTSRKITLCIIGQTRHGSPPFSPLEGNGRLN
jgi:hypothetical protein